MRNRAYARKYGGEASKERREELKEAKRQALTDFEEKISAMMFQFTTDADDPSYDFDDDDTSGLPSGKKSDD